MDCFLIGEKSYLSRTVGEHPWRFLFIFGDFSIFFSTVIYPKLNEGLTLLGQFKEINHETQNLPSESETIPTAEEPSSPERGEDSHPVVEGG